jgi:uncharacterized coiled-coil protein SlyX
MYEGAAHGVQSAGAPTLGDLHALVAGLETRMVAQEKRIAVQENNIAALEQENSKLWQENSELWQEIHQVSRLRLEYFQRNSVYIKPPAERATITSRIILSDR